MRLFRMAAEVLRAIEARMFHPVVGWHCKECPFRSKCWAWGREAERARISAIPPVK